MTTDYCDTAEYKEASRRFHEDALYFNEREEEFLRLYPDQWAAVYNKQFAGADADINRLLKDLKARGYPLESVVIRPMSTEDVTWIL